MTTRTDVLRVRLEADDDGKVKASLLGVADAADKVKASTGGTASGAKIASEALGELKKAGDEAEQSFLNNSRAITSFQDLLDDLASGQLGRAKREIAALANETNLLQKILSPVGGAITAAAAIVGVLVAGFIKGQEQTEAWNHAIAATGNVVGATTDQLESMTQTLGHLNGDYGGAREAILALAQSGKVAATSFMAIGQAALDMSRLTGKGVADSAKELADLADQPAKALQQYHLLTIAQYDQITALQRQGQQVTAEAVAERDYAQTLKQRAHDVEDSAGIMERAGRHIKAAWEDAWNAIDGIGRNDLQTRLASAEAELRRVQGLQDERKKLGTDHPGEESRNLAAQAAAAQALIDQIHGEMAAAGVQAFFTRDAALANSQALEAQQHLAQYMTPDQALKAAMDKAAQDKTRALYGVTDPAERAKIEAEFNEEVKQAHLAYDRALKHDNPGAAKGAAALSTLDQYVNGLDARSLQAASTPLTKYTDGIAKLVDEYDRAIAKGANAAAALADFDKGQQALQRDLDQTTKKLNEQDSAALTAYKNSLDKTNEALQQNIDAQVQRVGMGDREYALTQQITKAYRDEAEALARLQQQLENDLANGMDPVRAQKLYEEKEQALRDSTNRQVQIVQDGYARMTAAQADWHNGALQAMQNWMDQGNDVAGQTSQMFTDAFGQMNDALVNFVTTGKLNFGDLAKSIIADLARMELRVIESQILQKLLGAFLGGAGVGGSGVDTYGDGQFNSLTGYGTYTGAGSVSTGGYATGGAFDAYGALTAFANGGAFTNSIVTKPTLFAFANGTGVMGEAGPEAIMPLTRGPDGKLGVQATGGGGGPIEVNVITNVDNSGNATTKTSGAQQNQLVKQFGEQMKAVAQQEITRSTQPGGTLWKMRVGQA